MSLHADAVATLTRWNPPTHRQGGLRDQYLAHLAAHPDALDRSCHPDHLTASALVVSGGRVALTLHAKLGRWLQTGGHCESADRTLAGAALREAREETGIHDLHIDPAPLVLDRHQLPCGPIAAAHHLDVQFLATAGLDAHLVISAESRDLAWFSFDDLPADTDDSVRALVLAARARLSA